MGTSSFIPLENNEFALKKRRPPLFNMEKSRAFTKKYVYSGYIAAQADLKKVSPPATSFTHNCNCLAIVFSTFIYVI
jgi:hypothetical protein